MGRKKWGLGEIFLLIQENVLPLQLETLRTRSVGSGFQPIGGKFPQWLHIERYALSLAENRQFSEVCGISSCYALMRAYTLSPVGGMAVYDGRRGGYCLLQIGRLAMPLLNKPTLLHAHCFYACGQRAGSA
ncbi:MAG: hypothetical protein IJ808_00240 [Muribaculaceae bacterium]|nr:hypothetical protein [Muribaculaceae bacterium]